MSVPGNAIKDVCDSGFFSLDSAPKIVKYLIIIDDIVHHPILSAML